jgi:3D (Asp-Asp-Asp) domain-containing protein
MSVIEELGITLEGQDYTIPDLATSLKAQDQIEVVRVREKHEFSDEIIPFDSVTQLTNELEIDQIAVIQHGVPGILRQRTLIQSENGAEISRFPAGESIAQQPINEVVGYGTNIVVRTVDTPDGTLEYWRVVPMRVTAYTAATSGKERSHPAYGITASGVPAGFGVVAVDPAIVPFRSYVYVPGYGKGFAGDTGGGVKGRFIDLGYDEGQIVTWNGYVDVYYLTPVPPADQINYTLPTSLP